MLTVSKAIKAGQGGYYLSLSNTDDYYLKGDEPPGWWLGEGAAALGLTGNVQGGEFMNLLRGLSPDGEKKLVRNADSERRAGFDITWSAPKSVSVAWSQATPEVRAKIESCVRDAVKVGVAYIEEVAGITRRGEDGRIREKGKLIFAAFFHSTSRAQDPQLHVHTVLQNMVVRTDGKVSTLEPREIFRQQWAGGAVFRAELAALLERRLGLRAMREGWSFELMGVDRDLMDELSKRRKDIEEELKRHGTHGRFASEIAALNTREKKELITREELFARWREAGEQHHFTQKQLSFLMNAPFPARDMKKELIEATNGALVQLTRSKSFFSVRELTQAIAEEAQGRNLGLADIDTIREALLRSPELVRLEKLHDRDVCWTTQEILSLESNLLKNCGLLRDREVPFPTARILIEATIRRHTGLSDEQCLALAYVCESEGGIRVVSGMAGTGKSTLFRAARVVWEAQGFHVIGCALAGKAARGLEEATGIHSQTLHRTLKEIKRGAMRLNENAVVVLDESSMVGTRQLAKLVEACVASGAKLVLTGDEKQLQAIELGGAFAAIRERFGAVELTEIRRQREEWAREAVKDFAAGEAERALGAYAERGLVVETSKEKWEAIGKVVSDWRQEQTGNPLDTPIFSGTQANVGALNVLIQEERAKAEEMSGPTVAIGKDRFGAGDIVLFHKNSVALCVMNGDRGTVRKVEGKVLTVELESGLLTQVDSDAYRELRLGAAMTTHAGQGMTAENSFVYVSRMNDREMTYVQASRARGDTRWYIEKELSDVGRAMERSRKKLMAISLAGPELQQTLKR